MAPGKGLVIVLICGWAFSTVGCASLKDYNRIKAANLAIQSRTQSLESDLYDARSAADGLKGRAASLDDQLAGKNALVSNLQTENDRLAEMLRMAQLAVENVVNRYKPSDIAIAGPKLPHDLDKALKALADAHPGAVSYDAVHGTIKWKGDLLFPFASDVVADAIMPSLEGLAAVMNSQAAVGFEVIVVGHTDNVPIAQEETLRRHPTNWHLSVHRSISVCNVLIAGGLSTDRIGVMGCGEFRPVGPNDTDQGRGLNRRVEIYVVPRGSIVPSPADNG